MEEKINRKLLLMGFLAALLTLILTATAFYSNFDSQIKSTLDTELSLAAAAYNNMADAEGIKSLTVDPTLRITLVDTDGEVLFETDADLQEMENHLERPEIAQAFQTGKGTAVRYSNTLGHTEYYAAMRLNDGRVIRCSMSANVIRDFLWTCAPYLLLIFIAVVVLSIWLSSMLTRGLIQPIKAMSQHLDDPELLSDQRSDIYPELVPLIRELQSQRLVIREKMMLIEHEHRRFTAILKNMEEGLLLLDTEQHIISANSSARRYLNVHKEVIGHKLIEANRSPQLLEAVDSAFNGHHAGFDMPHDGRQIHVMVNPVTGGEELLGAVCLFVDVTERRELDRMKQEFTANVSHELKTPLTSISGYAEMIEAGIAREADVPGFAGRIRKESARLLALIGDIIQLSEIEENGRAVAKEPIDLFEIAKLCCDQLLSSARSRGIDMVLEGESTMIIASRTMTAELVYNLCDNALRYNRENGKVTVTVRDKTITVADTGIGIPAEHQGRIFERFYRVDKSRSKETGGTGLGLAIVKHIAEVHGAKLTLESREGFGTTIRVAFQK